MRKIFINKNEGVAEIVEKIIAELEPELILVIPKNSILTESISNFHLIRREAEASGKSIQIESVDENILSLAKASKLDSAHPFFEKKRVGSAVSDIVPSGTRPKSRKKLSVKDIESEDAEEDDDLDEEIEELSSKGERGGGFDNSPVLEHRHSRKRFFGPKFFIFVGLVIVVIIAGMFLINKFSQAEVIISFKKSPWQYQGTITANVSASQIDLSDNVVPASSPTEEKSSVSSFPASQKQNVADKATGKITIYNAYSSAKQSLVATTRFVTPDGKTFRIDKSITVPGAEVKDGKIIPSSIEADITADKAGTDYNLGPIDKLTIPGFKGSPKYSAFYGVIAGKTTGGFIGERLAPTTKDIAAAKTKVTDDLKASFKNSLFSKPPEGLKILDGATTQEIGKLSVITKVDEKGNFSVVGTITQKAIAFKESDLKTLLESIVAKDNPDMVFEKYDVTYSQITPDFKNNKLSLSISVKATLTQKFSPEEFKKTILGKKIEEAKSLVLKIPNSENARVRLWPSWFVFSIPGNASRVKITVN
ncbi:MAG: hypothetical protein WCX12_00615 [Candidatus Paceibacterota bacterium]|jgi:hypothetical protein